VKFDYPLTKQLVKIVEQEYRDEAIDKGNSWRQECGIDYLLEKLEEEFTEVQSAAMRGFPNGVIQAEIVDLILMAAMLHERLAGHKGAEHDDDTFTQNKLITWKQGKSEEAKS